MAWADPTTIGYNQLLDVATLNQYMVDNPLALKNPPQAVAQNWNVALSTTSTSFVNMTGVEVTITTTGGRLLIGFSIMTQASGGTSGDFTAFEITVDGVALSGHANGVAMVYSTFGGSIGMVYLSAALSAGAHTVRIQWRTTNAARTVSASKFQLWAREA